MTDNIFLTSSNDSMIKIWSISTLTCVANLEGHSNYVTSLCKMSDDIFISGSNDNTIS